MYKTDYRALMGEIFTDHFGDSMDILDQVIPGYLAAKAAYPSAFTPLNFL